MQRRSIRRALVAATTLVILAAVGAYADTVPADGDAVAMGNQTMIDLGQAGPGQVVTWPVQFHLTCAGFSHAAAGSTIQIDQGAVGAPDNGAISATSTTIGVPADWTPDSDACPFPAPSIAADAPSVVTLTMPTLTAIDDLFTVSWTRSPSTGLTSITAITFKVDVVPNTPPHLTVPADQTVEATGPGGAVAFTTDGTGSFTAAVGYSFPAPKTCTLVSDGNPATFTSKCSVTYTTTVANVDNIGAAYSGSTLHYPSTASTVMVVFYDPNAGFVTGGGYIDSPTGAAPAFPSAVGKANYGFVAKYQKNQTLPQGETEFQLKPANINFHSSSLDWLIVSNPTTSTQKAQYQGSGTNNGSGDYKFQVTVIDGGSTDYFRIKIWDRVSGAVLYDNMGTGTPGYPTAAPDGTNPTTLASGGNIVIHK